MPRLVPLGGYKFYGTYLLSYRSSPITSASLPQATRVGVVNAVYEARAVPGDHKQKEEQGGMSQGFGY